MLAREFFDVRQHEGRAVLTQVNRPPPTGDGRWGDGHWQPTRWLVSIQRRLILCTEDAIHRFVAEDEIVEETPNGFRLAHRVIEG